MDDPIIVHVFQTDDAASYEELCLLLSELLALIMMIAEVASSDEVCDQEHIFVILEGIKHVYQEGVLQLAQELLLIYY